MNRIIFSGVALILGATPGTVRAAAQVVDTVHASDLLVPALDPLQMLTGRVTGVRVVPVGDRPGAPPEVLLRGSAGRSGSPLFLVDGVIAASGATGLDPSIIERVEVMKGAAAAAMYGARAGNGVINIVTRRRTSSNRPTFGFRTEVSNNGIERDVPPARSSALLADPAEERFCAIVPNVPLCAVTVSWRAELDRINNVPGDTIGTPFQFSVDPSTTIPAAALSNSFQARRFAGLLQSPMEQLVRDEPLSLIEIDGGLTIAGTQLHGSLSRLGMPGMIRYLDGADRYGMRLAADRTFGQAFRASIRGFYGRSTEDGRLQYDNTFFVLGGLRTPVDLLSRDSLGRPFGRVDPLGQGAFYVNPILSIQDARDQAHTDRYNIGATVGYAPLAWLDVTADVALDRVAFGRTRQRDQTNRFGALPFITARTGRLNAVGYGLNATARHRIGRSLSLRSSLRLLGYDERESGRVVSGALNQPFPVFLTTSALMKQGGQGLVAGTILDFRGRYFVDALVRRDLQSVGAASTPSSTTGRLALAWHVSREPWWFSGAVTDLRLRVARGSAGGAPLLPRIYETGGEAGPAFTHPGAGATEETELGADVELFRRAGLTLTWSAAAALHQKFPGFLPAERALVSTWLDVARLDSRSLELAISLPIIRRRDAEWSWRVGYDRSTTRIGRLEVPPFFYASDFSNGANFLAREGESFAAIYGRSFATSCAELPTSFQGQCGDGRAFQRNDDGLIVWVGDVGGTPASWRDGITRNLWTARLDGSAAPWGVGLAWGSPIVVRDPACDSVPSPFCAARQNLLGSGMPTSQLSISTTARVGRFSVFAMLQGVMGRKVWNQGRQLSYLYGTSRETDQEGRSVEAAKPVSYYWRAGAPEGPGIGGLYDVLAPNSWFIESTDYAKLREVAVSFDIGPLFGRGLWTITAVGRNLLTFTGYSGFDPEVPLTGGYTGSINATDAYTFPAQRTIGVSLGARF